MILQLFFMMNPKWIFNKNPELFEKTSLTRDLQNHHSDIFTEVLVAEILHIV